MATLHLFNPEHDIALASNLSNFTSPHAGRQLRHDLGFLPAIWADETDYVLVDDIEVAKTSFSRLMHRQFHNFIDKSHLLSHASQFSTVNPWGWDLALRSFLLRYGVNAVPSEEEVAVIRDLSHRKHAVVLLGNLQTDGTVGQSWQVDSQEDVCKLLDAYRHIVVKAPWSSSGRGIRFIDEEMDDYQQRWIRNVIQRQGSVIVEVYQHKVKDFGMEFESDGNGNVRYLGLSLFHTQNGAYIGNILATEEEKYEMLSSYISIDLLNMIQANICDRLGVLYKGKYRGPFGVDMMIVTSHPYPLKSCFSLHPCVEINLRRTMGHVALELSKHCHSDRVMRIEFADNTYKLKIHQL